MIKYISIFVFIALCLSGNAQTTTTYMTTPEIVQVFASGDISPSATGALSDDGFSTIVQTIRTYDGIELKNFSVIIIPISRDENNQTKVIYAPWLNLSENTYTPYADAMSVLNDTELEMLEYGIPLDQVIDVHNRSQDKKIRDDFYRSLFSFIRRAQVAWSQKIKSE